MEEKLSTYIDNPIFYRIIAITIGIALIWLLIKMSRKALLSKFKDNENRYKAKKLSSFIGYFLTLILIVVVYNDKLGDFSVALGVAGAGIAFALQEVIASFAGWLAIMFGGFFKNGDRVQLGGIKGDVMDIGMLRTTIMETGQWVDGDLYNGRIVLIANSFVFKEPVFNYSGDFPFLWDEIKIPIQFGSNYEKAKEIMELVGKEVACDLSVQSHKEWKVLQYKYLLEDARTEPMVSLTVNNSGVELTLRYVVGYRRRRVTKTDLFTKILQKIEATNGEVKFPSGTLQVLNPPGVLAKNEINNKE